MISNMLRFPFSMFDENMESLFYPELFRRSNRAVQSAYPPINVGTTDRSVEVYLFVPGVIPDQLDVVIEKNLLSVAGERPALKDENGTNGGYRRERFEGRFKRVITLPESVDADSAQAEYKNGILHISIAKRPESQPRQIKISAQ